MTDPNKTLITTILDRSGSMEAIRKDMEGGFNTFIAEQKAQPGECLVSLYQFDELYEVVYENKPIAEVPGLELKPRGSTALLDALGFTIARVGAQLEVLPESSRPGAVIIQVITDGQENASKEFNLTRVKDMIKEQHEKYNWQFLYLGASLTTMGDARSLGISQSARYVASSAGIKGMYSDVSEASIGYRRAVRGGAKDAKIKLDSDTNKNS